MFKNILCILGARDRWLAGSHSNLLPAGSQWEVPAWVLEPEAGAKSWFGDSTKLCAHLLLFVISTRNYH